MFFDNCIQIVNLGQKYVQFAELLLMDARKGGSQRENFCDQATKCNTVNALALRGDEGRSKLR